ncbi:MAG: DUF86 domain-containing protein [Asticcacaulis sp.]
MSSRWQVHAKHILDCRDKLNRIRARGNILDDEILYDAALRNLQTLSESCQKLPEFIKLRYSHIEWQKISGFRNILVHNYLGNIDPVSIEAVIAVHVEAVCSVVELALEQVKDDGPL